MHDLAELEALGLPGVMVASTEFRDAVDAQSEALGTQPAVVFALHPIQNRTDEEMRALAERTLPELLSHLYEADRTGDGG